MEPYDFGLPPQAPLSFERSTSEAHNDNADDTAPELVEYNGETIDLFSNEHPDLTPPAAKRQKLDHYGDDQGIALFDDGFNIDDFINAEAFEDTHASPGQHDAPFTEEHALPAVTDQHRTRNTTDQHNQTNLGPAAAENTAVPSTTQPPGTVQASLPALHNDGVLEPILPEATNQSFMGGAGPDIIMPAVPIPVSLNTAFNHRGLNTGNDARTPLTSDHMSLADDVFATLVRHGYHPSAFNNAEFGQARATARVHQEFVAAYNLVRTCPAAAVERYLQRFQEFQSAMRGELEAANEAATRPGVPGAGVRLQEVQLNDPDAPYEEFGQDEDDIDPYDGPGDRRGRTQPARFGQPHQVHQPLPQVGPTPGMFAGSNNNQYPATQQYYQTIVQTQQYSNPAPFGTFGQPQLPNLTSPARWITEQRALQTAPVDKPAVVAFQQAIQSNSKPAYRTKMEILANIGEMKYAMGMRQTFHATTLQRPTEIGDQVVDTTLTALQLAVVKRTAPQTLIQARYGNQALVGLDHSNDFLAAIDRRPSALTDYVHPRATAVDKHENPLVYDRTSFHPGQANWCGDNANHIDGPQVMYQISLEAYKTQVRDWGLPPAMVDYRGEIVTVCDRPLFDWEVSPDKIGRNECWWNHECFRRVDPRFDYTDHLQRVIRNDGRNVMKRNALQNQSSRARPLWGLTEIINRSNRTSAQPTGRTQQHIAAGHTRGLTPGLIDPTLPDTAANRVRAPSIFRGGFQPFGSDNKPASGETPDVEDDSTLLLEEKWVEELLMRS